MEKNTNFIYKNLSPFKWFVLENFPFLEADFDALTEWQLFCKLGKEINKIINSTNTLGTQVETLTDFVSNYFENLDVQDEINNKLDQMAESGELEELISQYLQLAGLLCFNTVNDMKNATNLIDGSFAKTFGKNTYNDGLGEFYKIREILNTDVVDNVNIIPLTNHNNLIAELIPNSHIESLQTQINNINNNVLTDIESLQTQINNINNNVLTDIVVIGDSYTAFSSSTWAEDLAHQLNLTLRKHATSSMGYAHQIDNKTFVDLLDWSDTSFYNKVKYVICYGGVNDYDMTEQQIKTGVLNFINKAKTNFPNARILLVGPQTAANQYNLYALKEINAISTVAKSLGVAYANAYDWLWNNSNFYYGDTYIDDNLHPSALGYNIIVSNMLSLLNGQPVFVPPIKLKLQDTVQTNWRMNVNTVHNSHNINIKMESITATNGVFTPLLEFDCDLYLFMRLNQRLAVYATSNYYDNSYVTKLLGYTRIAIDGKISFVNISGTDYSGPIEIVGTLNIGSLE